MALVVDLLYSNFGTTRGLGFGGGTEMYYVKDDGVAPIHEAINRSNEIDWVNAVPVTTGAAHPTITGALCKYKGVVEVTGPRAARVIVVYSSDVRWGSGNVLESGSANATEHITVPNWRFLGFNDDGFPMLDWSPYHAERPLVYVYKTRYVNSWTDAQNTQVNMNVNRWYVLGGLPYLLRGADVRKLPTNQTIVRYTFLYKGEVPGYVGDGRGTWADIPGLGPWDEYGSAYLDGDIPVFPILAAIDRYDQGGSLPGYPP